MPISTSVNKVCSQSVFYLKEKLSSRNSFMTVQQWIRLLFFFFPYRKSVLRLNRIQNVSVFANLRIILFNYLDFFFFEVLLQFRWTEVFKILKKKKKKSLQYAFCGCTHIGKVMQVDPGPVSVVMSPQWIALLKSLFLLDNIWVWSHIPVFGHDEDSSSTSAMKGVSSCFRKKTEETEWCKN